MIGPFWIFGNAILTIVGVMSPWWGKLLVLPFLIGLNVGFAYLAYWHERWRRMHTHLGRHRLTVTWKP